MNGVHVAEWAKEVTGAVVAGSLYAVEPGLRFDAAAALAEAGCDIHADVILRGDGAHRGVTPDELADVRSRMPHAHIDVHVIVDDETPTALSQLKSVLDAALRIRAEKVTVSASAHSAFADRLAALRRAGIGVWREVAPGNADAGDLGDVDGALVMFIPPGTSETADASQLPLVAALAAHVPVGVDGGVTPDLARSSVIAGASFIVSGRALLRAAVTSTEGIPS